MEKKSMILPPPPSVEIEIFTEEQLNILPEEAKTSIISLEKELPKKQLLILNPLVLKLLKAKELENIKYVPLPENATKEQIAEHKESIEKFKAAKKELIALKKQNADAKSEIKKPIDEIGSNVLKIEKAINTIVGTIAVTLEEIFKPYIDAEANKKAEALKKKNEKATEAINKLSEENAEQANKFKKSQLITYLKYEMLLSTKEATTNAIANYSLEKLIQYRNELELRTFNSYTEHKEEDLKLLSPEELADTISFFEKEKGSLVVNIDIQINALRIAENNKELSRSIAPPPVSAPATNTIAPPPGVSAPPVTPQVPISPIAATDVFNVINNHSNTPFGAGANQITANVPQDLYPKNSNEVDFLDLVLAELNKCMDNVEYIRKRYIEDLNITKSEFDKANIERVRGVKFLMEKTIDYVQNNPTNIQPPPISY